MKFINYIEVNFNLFIIPLSSKFYLSLILNSIIKDEGSLKGEGYFRAAENFTPTPNLVGLPGIEPGPHAPPPH